MMSLFTGFDLLCFNFPLLTFIFLFWGAMNFIFPITSMIKVFNFFFIFLSSFFNSLNNSNFSKNLNLFMLVVLFMIFCLNFYSIFPFLFPVTSQTSFVLIFSLIFWSSIMMMSMGSKFKGQFSHFIPEGAPLGLSPLLFVIEIVSISIRPLTLMIRLVANILAGHLLLILLCSFVQNFPLFFPLLSALNMVELAVALIQSYILATLISLYYSEV